jgi:Tfp pilus assembly protein PilO
MGRVWLVVFASMLFVAISGFAWHFLLMMKLETAQLAEQREVRERNETLSTYLAAHATTTPVTPPTTPL